MKVSLLFILVLTLLASCGGPSGPGSSFDAHSFVKALNTVDGQESAVVVQPNFTMRDQYSNAQWFVIYDAKDKNYKAVSLGYLQNLYVSLNSNDLAVAQQFRGDFSGEGNGSEYESVSLWFDPTGNVVGANDFNRRFDGMYYQGQVSGAFYEDEVGTTDVSLMAKETEEHKFLNKAAKVSVLYNVDIKTSLNLVVLGQKIEKILSRNQDHLTQADQSALLKDMESLIGVGFEEMKSAINEPSAKEAMLDKVAAKIGTSADNLEEKILPSLFGIQ